MNKYRLIFPKEYEAVRKEDILRKVFLYAGGYVYLIIYFFTLNILGFQEVSEFYQGVLMLIGLILFFVIEGFLGLLNSFRKKSILDPIEKSQFLDVFSIYDGLRWKHRSDLRKELRKREIYANSPAVHIQSLSKAYRGLLNINQTQMRIVFQKGDYQEIRTYFDAVYSFFLDLYDLTTSAAFKKPRPFQKKEADLTEKILKLEAENFLAELHAQLEAFLECSYVQKLLETRVYNSRLNEIKKYPWEKNSNLMNPPTKNLIQEFQHCISTLLAFEKQSSSGTPLVLPPFPEKTPYLVELEKWPRKTSQYKFHKSLAYMPWKFWILFFSVTMISAIFSILFAPPWAGGLFSIFLLFAGIKPFYLMAMALNLNLKGHIDYFRWELLERSKFLPARMGKVFLPPKANQELYWGMVSNEPKEELRFCDWGAHHIRILHEEKQRICNSLASPLVRNPYPNLAFTGKPDLSHLISFKNTLVSFRQGDQDLSPFYESERYNKMLTTLREKTEPLLNSILLRIQQIEQGDETTQSGGETEHNEVQKSDPFSQEPKQSEMLGIFYDYRMGKLPHRRQEAITATADMFGIGEAVRNDFTTFSKFLSDRCRQIEVIEKRIELDDPQEAMKKSLQHQLEEVRRSKNETEVQLQEKESVINDLENLVSQLNDDILKKENLEAELLDIRRELEAHKAHLREQKRINDNAERWERNQEQLLSQIERSYNRLEEKRKNKQLITGDENAYIIACASEIETGKVNLLQRIKKWVCEPHWEEEYRNSRTKAIVDESNAYQQNPAFPTANTPKEYCQLVLKAKQFSDFKNGTHLKQKEFLNDLKASGTGSETITFSTFLEIFIEKLMTSQELDKIIK